MRLDWDGKIRMDCSSPYAMAGLIANRDQFDLAFACDTDHDRHGIVTRSAGLLPPNHYLSAAIWYLFGNRPGWPATSAVGANDMNSLSFPLVRTGSGVLTPLQPAKRAETAPTQIKVLKFIGPPQIPAPRPSAQFMP